MSASTSSAGDSNTGTSGATGEAIGGQIDTLSLSSDGGSLDLSSVQPDDEVLLMVYSHNDDVTTEGFDLYSESAPPDENNVLGLVQNEEPESVAIEGAKDITEDFHEMLREREQELNGDAAHPDSTRFLGSSDLGSQRDFHVLSSFTNVDSYEDVTATLRLENDEFRFYVDERDADRISDADLAILEEDFLSALPDERELFGTESDVDSDGKFSVLFTQVVNGLGGSQGGIVTGFFYAQDLLSASDYPDSNETEVFYTFVPDPSGDVGSAISESFAMNNILPGVLVHEFQHMINFNRHYFENGGSGEAGWLNEGMSHLAEDLYSMNSDGYMAHAGIENPARVSAYLNDISDVCFTCGTSLAQRGGSYLFLRYLYEQAEQGELSAANSGAELIDRLLSTTDRGTDNVKQAAFGSASDDTDFANILGLYHLAVYLSNTGLSSDARLNFDGIDLRGSQNDNRGTVLDGPAITSLSSLPYTGTLQGNGAYYLQMSGQTLLDSGDAIQLTFDSGASFGGYLIRQ